MIELTLQNIRLAVRARDKEEAIRAVGQVLVDTGAIAPAYVESMLGRELQANTYLGHGIAIPHGMAADRGLIRRTSVAVVQVPDGVEWGPGQIVRIVFGIAAMSDEHLGVLAALGDVLDDDARASDLAQTRDPAVIIAALGGPKGSEAARPADLEGARHVDVTLREGAGLHARPATFFVEVAARFAAEIRLTCNGRSANGKAMASLLKLGAPGGASLRITAAGADADAALAALRDAVASGLGEEEGKRVATATRAWIPVSNGRSIGGISASPGLAIGRLHQLTATRVVVHDAPGDPAIERRRLADAIAVAREQLGDVYEAMVARSGKSEGAIFRAHQAFLDDVELRAEAHAIIDAGHGAAWSWQGAIAARVAEVKQVEDVNLAARAIDLHDVGQRVLRVLAGTEHGATTLPDEPVILIAEDLTPSDTAKLDPRRILGLCTAAGGATSHTAIIACSLGIPAIVGAGAAVLELAQGTTCVLDGGAGLLYIAPSPADLDSARRFQLDLGDRRAEEHRTRYEPALMTDGRRIEVVANIAKASEAELAVEAGAEGVGLLRTELLFLDREAAPSEEEQLAAYAAMTRALNGLPLVIRTLDIGGDKVVPYLSLPKEDNPFLGVRGIRLCLRMPDLFIPQLRAIYRAAATGPVKIMFPMVATLEELRAAKALAEQVRRELGAPRVDIGIMIEVPSAVAMAPELAEECDFFSVGTNDLTQYMLAMDRLHAGLAKQIDALHPAVLRMIDATVRAADAAGKWVGVCGGIAGDPRGAVILAGLGVTELSMSLPSIAAVKAHLRGTSHARAKAVSKLALACKTADEVRALPLPA